MARLASRERLSFSKLREVKELPNLIEVQTDSFRWLLEELKVSLFAQELRTPFPVSFKRVEKAWAELSR